MLSSNNFSGAVPDQTIRNSKRDNFQQIYSYNLRLLTVHLNVEINRL